MQDPHYVLIVYNQIVNERKVNALIALLFKYDLHASINLRALWIYKFSHAGSDKSLLYNFSIRIEYLIN